MEGSGISVFSENVDLSIKSDLLVNKSSVQHPKRLLFDL